MSFVFLFLFVCHSAPFLAKNYMAWTDEVRTELSAYGMGKAVPDCTVPEVRTPLAAARQMEMVFTGLREASSGPGVWTPAAGLGGFAAGDGLTASQILVQQ
jgi:hypothetical protein